MTWTATGTSTTSGRSAPGCSATATRSSSPPSPAAAEGGTIYGTPNPWEVELAERIHQALPSMERIRFVTTGTEAVMSAVRVARAFTGRPKIIKMEGCYHGHSDFALIAAGSGPSQLGTPDSAGVTEGVAQDVITVPYNDLDSLGEALDVWGPQVAAVLVEPIVGNFGVAMPKPGYLEGVKRLAHAARSAADLRRGHHGLPGGVRRRADPAGDRAGPDDAGQDHRRRAAAGRLRGPGEIMDWVAPLGPAYQAGTLAGNPLCMQVAR